MLEIQLQSADSSAPITINRYNFLVGRHSTCNLVLNDASVSKMHCVLLHRGNQVLITDLGSRSGTIVEGTRLNLAETAPLQHGDQIQLGDARLTLSILDVASRQPAYCQPEYLVDLPFPFVRIDGRKSNLGDASTAAVGADPYDTVEPESQGSVISCAEVDVSTGASTIITEDDLGPQSDKAKSDVASESDSTSQSDSASQSDSTSQSDSDSQSESYSTIDLPDSEHRGRTTRGSIRANAPRKYLDATGTKSAAADALDKMFPGNRPKGN